MLQMSCRSLSLVLLLVVAARCQAQADKFWWLKPLAEAQQDSVMPGTIPPAVGEGGGEGGSGPPPPPVAAPAQGPEDDEVPCICVDFYLCDPATLTIITTGEGIVDVRAGFSNTGKKCNGFQVCCKPPKNPMPASLTATTTTAASSTSAVLHPLEECGIRSAGVVDISIDERIVNVDGDPSGGTEFGEFPWTLVLLRSGPSQQNGQHQDNMFVCGASLVHRQVAMTAAHCVARKRITELKVRAGEWDTQRESEPLPHQERKVSRVVVHPDFYRRTLYNDVALLFLDSPFQLERHVRTICMPQQGDVLDGSRCIATGWGKNSFDSNGTYQMIMKMVDQPVLGHDICQELLRGTRLGLYFNLHESFVCAGGEEGKDTCKGDGGGPLFCQHPQDSGRYVQLGITSWGIGCGDTNVPAVYANVPSFADWVTTQVFDAFGS